MEREGERKWRKTEKGEEDLKNMDIGPDTKLDSLRDPSTAAKEVRLLGHGGPVYSMDFSPDNRFLLSASEDATGGCSGALSLRVLLRCRIVAPSPVKHMPRKVKLSRNITMDFPVVTDCSPFKGPIYLLDCPGRLARGKVCVH